MEWGGVGLVAGGNCKNMWPDLVWVSLSAAWEAFVFVVLFNILLLLPHLWWYRVSLVVLVDYRLLLTANIGC